MKEFDTIAAIATPIGEGGISIIRVSGSNSLNIVNNIFKSKSSKSILDMKSYTMRYGYIINDTEIIDEVIVSFMKGPKSFTSEDVVEINCHGGIVSTNKVLDSVIKYGARLAEPGEFTKRAFLNGRIDLSQAEAVIDIIRAKTDVSMKSALSQSQGLLSREINKLREYLLNVLALIEYAVDFTEDEEEPDDTIPVRVEQNIEKSIYKINKLIENAEEGKILREGLKLVIIGKPNVGKSSLLNSLLKENRAIVTDIPGTTRDVIEEYINLDGIPIKIIDTAGIRETEDLVEQIGVQRSKEKIDEADLIILILDISRNFDEEDREIINYIKDKKHIVILNKIDLEFKMNSNEFKTLDSIIQISAKTGVGLEELKDKIKELFFNGKIQGESIIVSNARHMQALYRAKENCQLALNSIQRNEFLDLISIYVTSGLKALGEITGSEVEEDLINKIFSEFCVGK